MGKIHQAKFHGGGSAGAKMDRPVKATMESQLSGHHLCEPDPDDLRGPHGLSLHPLQARQGLHGQPCHRFAGLSQEIVAPGVETVEF